ACPDRPPPGVSATGPREKETEGSTLRGRFEAAVSATMRRRRRSSWRACSFRLAVRVSCSWILCLRCSAASAAAFNDKTANRRSISFIGDGGFWHNGLTSSVGNAVFNDNDGVIVIVDNYYSAATGGQDILSSRAENMTKSTQHPIKQAIEGIGVKWVRQIDHTYDVGKVQATLKEALTTPETGPKVIIASSECMLNRQRREKPLRAKAVAEGRRITRTRFGVDEDICTGDHACIRLSGCPSLSLKQLDDPLRDDPVAHIDENCVGCGNCGEVADAAVLCPSFYQAEVVSNPTRWDRIKHQMRQSIITWMQRRQDKRRLVFSGSDA
ncbi:MAG: thiamine pyrophosphate-dependent enzyme, partial [Paracoccaceae bacterium]